MSERKGQIKKVRVRNQSRQAQKRDKGNQPNPKTHDFRRAGSRICLEFVLDCFYYTKALSKQTLAKNREHLFQQTLGIGNRLQRVFE